jgi:hypothetical protein
MIFWSLCTSIWFKNMKKMLLQMTSGFLQLESTIYSSEQHYPEKAKLYFENKIIMHNAVRCGNELLLTIWNYSTLHIYYDVATKQKR